MSIGAALFVGWIYGAQALFSEHLGLPTFLTVIIIMMPSLVAFYAVIYYGTKGDTPNDRIRCEAWQDGHDTALINGQSQNPYEQEPSND